MNKKIYVSLFSISSIGFLTYKFHDNYLIWSIIHKYDKNRLAEPIWKSIFRKKMDKNIEKHIVRMIENYDYNKEFEIKDANDDAGLYQSGWYPSGEKIKSIFQQPKFKNKFSNVKITGTKYPYNHLIKLKYNIETRELNVVIYD